MTEGESMQTVHRTEATTVAELSIGLDRAMAYNVALDGLAGGLTGSAVWMLRARIVSGLRTPRRR
jgi:hypothetical protein